MKKLSFVVLSVFYVTLGCQPDPVIVSGGERAAASGARVNATAGFTTRTKLGTVKDGNLDEISGVVYSRTNAGYLWVNEDSGNPNKIFLLDASGNTRATITLPSNASNRDWEDIAVGPGPQANTNYIYLADIGDNSAAQSKIYVYRFIEPSIAGKSLPYAKTLSNSDVQKLDFSYADGARNAETLLIDPVTRDLFFIAKEDNGDNKTSYTSKGGIYRAAYPQNETATTKLYRTGAVNVFTATGGDISAGGNEVLIKNYDRVYYWKKTSSSQTITQLLQTTPTTLYYLTEPGGEAIGWKTDATGYYTISEVKNNIAAAIYFYPR